MTGSRRAGRSTARRRTLRVAKTFGTRSPRSPLGLALFLGLIVFVGSLVLSALPAAFFRFDSPWLAALGVSLQGMALSLVIVIGLRSLSAAFREDTLLYGAMIGVALAVLAPASLLVLGDSVPIYRAAYALATFGVSTYLTFQVGWEDRRKRITSSSSRRAEARARFRAARRNTATGGGERPGR